MKIDLSKLHDKEYRLNTLYRIIDKNSRSIPFRMNATQKEVFEGLHNRNLILKARQLGMSTFCILYLLDEVIFNYNTSAGIISYSLPHAQYIFKNIVGHALDTFPVELPDLGIIAKSTKEIKFNNSSDFRVDTSLRGGTTQLVLITEYGKTCARSPFRAEEIIAGTLESVPINGKVLIESTGEGTSGPFAEMCLATHSRGNADLTDLDYKLHFFPWYLEPAYTIDHPIELDLTTKDYFTRIEHELGREFAIGQKRWYFKKFQVLGDKVRQEYPSTVDEAFLSNADAFYYAAPLQKARTEDRVINSELYDPLLPVYVAMDIAVTDYTVMTFFQIHHQEVRIIDAYGDTNKGVAFYTRFLLKEKPYVYKAIYLPHDARKKDGIVVENTYQKEFQRLMNHTGTKVIVLPRTDRNIGIGNAINQINRCVFNERKCKELVEYLGKYRKKWSERHGKYLDDPYHDRASDYADSFRYAMQAVTHIDRVGDSSGLNKHRKAVEQRNNLI